MSRSDLGLVAPRIGLLNILRRSKLLGKGKLRRNYESAIRIGNRVARFHNGSTFSIFVPNSLLICAVNSAAGEAKLCRVFG